MNAFELLAHIRRLGGRLAVEGGRLRVSGPKGMLTPELQAQVAAHKPELLALLAGVAGPPGAEGGAPPEGSAGPPPKRLPRADRLPLSFAQQRLWFLHQFLQAKERDNVPLAFRLVGDLDVDALGAAFTQLVERHESLRTVFVSDEGTPSQRIELPRPLRVVAEDPARGPGETPAAAAERLADAEGQRPFALDREIPLRVRLWRVGPREHLLLVVLHHIATDGWSLGLLRRDLAGLYGAAVRGGRAQLPDLPLQYADFAGWQRERLAGDESERLLAWWKRRLEGLAPLQLPTDRPRPPRQSFSGAREDVVLDARLTEALDRLSQRTGGTLFMTLLAAFSVLLQRYARQDDIAVGSPIGNRGRPEFENLVGCFLNMLVLRTDVSGDPTFLALLERVRATTLGAFEHQALPFEKLVEELVPERDLAASPLFQVFFAVQNAPARPFELSGLAASDVELPRRHLNVDLDVHVLREEAGLRVALLYRTDLFDAGTIRALGGAFRALLASLVERPEAPLSTHGLLEDPSLLATADLGGEIGGGAGGSGAVGARGGATAGIHGLVAAQCARTPTAVAVVHEGGRLSYAELDARVARLARRLAAAGVGPEVPVGLRVERGPDMLVGLLAILRAGGAYLPLDPALPAERSRFLLADSGAPLVLTQASLLGSLPDFGGRALCLAEELAAPDTDRSGPAPITGPDSLAYVIYTSGSTGQPKGVEVTHGSVVNFLRSMHERPGLGAGDALLAVTTLSFDIAGLELLAPLSVGARVIIASRETAADGHRLAAALRDSGATLMQATPATWQMLLHAGWTGDAHLKMLCGGEALPRPLADQLLARGGELWNMYGPTETTIWSAVSRVEPGSGPVTIGTPIANTGLHVLDGQLRPVPQGVPGELCISGAGLARGYHGRPELTAEKFVASPRPDELPGRLYRTGDLVRRDAAGRLQFLGRLDDQVKLRGFRIELGEIESVLARHPGVSRAAALVLDGPGDDQRLVAFWVPATGDGPDGAGGRRPGGVAGGVLGEAPDETGLREFLRAQLPDYMVPGAFVALDALPLSPAGKVDRRRLAELRPALTAAPAGAVFEPPRSPTEEAVASAFREVLHLPRVGARDDFFRLGGHSLLATRLVSRIRSLFSVELPLSEVFEAPTVAGLAQRIERLRHEAGAEPLPPIRTVPRDGPLPLSFAQNRLWLIDQMGAGAGYAIRMELGLHGPLDVAALERALNAIVARHETLRTRFVLDGNVPRQVIDPARPLPLARIDLGAAPPAERARALREFGAAEDHRPFDLARGPVFRAALVRFGDGEHVLSLGFHHVVADGWSFGILRQEVAAHYRACLLGEPVDLPPLAVQYADFATWQRQALTDEALAGHLAWWTRQLAGGVPALELPTDRPRPPVQSFEGAACRLSMGCGLRDELAGLARAHDATMAMVCLAAFQALLARCSGQELVVVGAPIANRTRAEVEGLVGFFVNSLVMRADLSGDPRFTALLRQVRDSSLAAYDHQDLPFERLVEAIEPVRDPSRTPLFQVVFAMHQHEQAELAAAGLRLTMRAPDIAVTRFDLELHLFEGPEGLDATLVYSTALFDQSTMERLAGHYRTLLEGIARSPEARVSELPLLSAPELADAITGWNATDRPIPGSGCLHHLVEEQARLAPGATAVVHHDEALTYAQLNARANRVARALVSMGARRDMLVGLCVRRGVDLAVGLLGILKAGAAYVPLDPAYPSERLAFMLADAEVSLLVTQGGLLAGLPPHGAAVLCLDDDRARLEAEPADDLGLETRPDDLAYAIFTSGSTGRPKAALLRHRGLCNVSHEQARAFGVGPGSRVLQFSSLSFDASTFELTMALPKGATLSLGDREDLLPGPDLLGFLDRHAISIVTLPPTALSALPAAELPALRTITVAGEACPAELVARWAPGRRFFNLYGPTEATIWSTTAELRPGDEPHIGRPIANTRIWLLDAYGNPVPVGVPGEICIGGVGLARGYFNRPALSAERFVDNPFVERLRAAGQEPFDGRMYRTGDLGRRRPDGSIAFVGRIDHQVKLRGHRIELGEVESVLDRHPAVKQSLAMVREDIPGDRRLVAYVLHDPEGEQAGSPTERAGWEVEHVEQWRDLYEESYGEALPTEDRTFNISSWDSSYTGGPIPAPEMKEWLERTVESVLATRPGRVLELGCGLGLILFRVAPHCAEYVGADFSGSALDYVQRHLGELPPGSAAVRLERRAAHDLAGLPAGHFDTIVLNSVVQYFPGVDYLVRVLEGVVPLLAPGGRIFVGDVRSLPLLPAFHASVAAFQWTGEPDPPRLRQRIHQLMNQDQELVIDPGFFIALRDRVPRLAAVGIEPKRGRYDNELGRFRYDVLLALDDGAQTPPAEGAAGTEWLDWQGDGLDLPALRRRLRSGAPARLGVRGIPNRRTAPHVAAASRLLAADDAPAAGSTPSASVAGAPADVGLDPDDLRELARELPYACAVSWAAGRPDGSFDVVFRRREADEPALDPLAANPPPLARPRPWEAFANRPLRGRLLRELVPALRRHAAASLPESMLPSAYVVLDAFPVTPNGKVDRAALPAPDSLRVELEQAFEAPRDESERVLAATWARVLNLERVGVHDNFFELGGDSILAIHVVAAAREAGLQFGAKDLFQHPTVAGLAKVAVAATAGTAAACEQGLVTGPVPLTPIQRWFFDQELAGELEDPQHFNQSLLFAPRRALQPDRLQAALLRLVGQHDALRLRFRRGPEGWSGELAPLPEGVPLEVHDLSGLGEAERAVRLEAEAARLQAGLDLGSGLLLSAAVFRFPAGRPDALLLVIHHLAVDAVSWSPLLADLQRALEQLESGIEGPLPPKTTSIAAWSAALAAHAATPQVAREARHWLGLPWNEVRPLPVDHPRGANTPGAARTLEVELDAERTRALLQDLPAAFGTDINSALLTALARAVADWTGHGHVLLDLEGHGRESLPGELDVSRTVGWFTTMHPVLLALPARADPVATLRAVSAQLGATPGHGLAFGLARHLSPDAGLAGALSALPRAPILFNYLGQLDRALGAEAGFERIEAPIGPSRSPRGRRSHLLELNGGVSGGRLRMQWTWGGEVHDEGTIASVARRFVAELEALVDGCGREPDRPPAPAAPRLGGFGWSADDIEDILSDIDERS